MTFLPEFALSRPEASADYSSDRKARWALLVQCVPMLHAYVRRLVGDQEMRLRSTVSARAPQPCDNSRRDEGPPTG